MQRITINGVTVEVPDGQNVSVVNGQVIVGDSVQVIGDGINIQTNGSKFKLVADGDVIVHGNIAGGIEAKGKVECKNVTGGVVTKGDVECQNVVGGIKAGNDVVCSGNVIGGIKCNTYGRPDDE